MCGHVRHQELRGDEELKERAGELKVRFLTHKEALLHGDLHTGPVMVSPDDTRVIDPEVCPTHHPPPPTHISYHCLTRLHALFTFQFAWFGPIGTAHDTHAPHTPHATRVCWR
jgi:hypothetical protein